MGLLGYGANVQESGAGLRASEAAPQRVISGLEEPEGQAQMAPGSAFDES